MRAKPTAAHVKVVQRRELTFGEKLYVAEIVRGLKITSAHFFRNLFLHAAHSFGLLKHIPAAVTFLYPEILRPLAIRFRSRHRLTVREEGTPRCVGCMLCEMVCPAKCITIVAGEHPDPNVEKYPVRFDIGCDRCVDACQVDVFLPNTEKGKPPMVAFRGECWYSGDCVSVCPVPGATHLNVMEKNRVQWKRKKTGEEFQL